LSPYGMAAIDGLVGLFSDQAASMLKKIFSNLFTSAKFRYSRFRATQLEKLTVYESLRGFPK